MTPRRAVERLERRWRPTDTRPREGWEVLPSARWVVAGAAAAAVLLVLCIAAAVTGH